MKWRQWLENWEMTSLKINTAFLNMEWEPRDADKEADASALRVPAPLNRTLDAIRTRLATTPRVFDWYRY